MSAIPGYFTIYEAARVLGRDHSTVCRYIRHGQLDAKTVGREKLIPADALKSFTPPEPGNPTLKNRKPRQR